MSQPHSTHIFPWLLTRNSNKWLRFLCSPVPFWWSHPLGTQDFVVLCILPGPSPVIHFFRLWESLLLVALVKWLFFIDKRFILPGLCFENMFRSAVADQWGRQSLTCESLRSFVVTLFRVAPFPSIPLLYFSFLLFFFFLLFSWILVAASRIFDLHCSMSDL